jgi:hypothetical protein
MSFVSHTELRSWDLALPIYCAEVRPIDEGPLGEASYREPTGTGFVVAPGILVTCWHCVRIRTDGLMYAPVSLSRDGVLGHHLLTKIAPDPNGRRDHPARRRQTDHAHSSISSSVISGSGRE